MIQREKYLQVADLMLCDQSPCDQQRDIAAEMHSLGAALQVRGDNVNALALYSESISAVNTSLDQSVENVQDSWHGFGKQDDAKRRLAMIEQATRKLRASPCSVTADNNTQPYNSSEAHTTVPLTEVHKINLTSNSTRDWRPAVTLYNMALINLQIENSGEALKLFEAALSVLTKKNPYESASQGLPTAVLSSALNNIGHILYTCDRPEDAANMFSEALQITQAYSENCNRSKHSHVSIIVTNLALALNRMGEAFEVQGQLCEAMKFYRLALKKYEGLSCVRGAWMLRVFSIIARNLGAIHNVFREDVSAMKALEVSLLLQKEAVGNNTCSQVTQLTLVVEILKLTASDTAAPAA